MRVTWIWATEPRRQPADQQARSGARRTGRGNLDDNEPHRNRPTERNTHHV